MKNISQISSISVLEAENKTVIKYIYQSASLYIENKKTNQGRLLTYSLKFKIAGLNETTADVVKRIRCGKIIEIVDIGGIKTMIGNEELHYNYEITTVNSGVAGGFRGYEIEVEWSNS